VAQIQGEIVMRIPLVPALIAAAIALHGCTSTGEPELRSVPVAIAAPVPGKGQVVFFRPGSFLGMAVPCTIREEGRMVGRVGDGRYFAIPEDPGTHTFTVKTEATDTLQVNVQPDVTTYVKCRIGMGFLIGRPNLSSSDAQEFAARSQGLRPQDAKKMAEEIAKDDADRARSDTAKRSDH
jgi:hypothetical protein